MILKLGMQGINGLDYDGQDLSLAFFPKSELKFLDFPNS